MKPHFTRRLEGAPPPVAAVVLLCKDFRYFGDVGTADYKDQFPAIKKLVEGFNRNHRVNHSPDLRHQLLQLAESAWRQHHKMKIGNATDPDRSARCNTETPSCSVR